MAYNGSMELPSGIKSLGNYPLVNATDVYVTDTTRLSDELVSLSASVSTLNNTVVSLPAPNNGTLTIQRNSATIGTFSANQASAATINISVPTQASDIGALPDSTPIPDPANNGLLTIQKNGATVGTFSADQASATTINIEVPTVNDATINIQVGGETQGSFTLNQASNESINLPVATAVEIKALFDKYKGEGNS